MTFMKRITINDLADQRAGRDAKITHAWNVTHYCEEKLINGSYDNLYLEYLSSVEHNRLGWMEKELRIDYLVWVFRTSGKCWAFNWERLRQLWRISSGNWKERFPISDQPNDGYTTRGVIVPIDRLDAVRPLFCQVKPF